MVQHFNQKKNMLFLENSSVISLIQNHFKKKKMMIEESDLREWLDRTGNPFHYCQLGEDNSIIYLGFYLENIVCNPNKLALLRRVTVESYEMLYRDFQDSALALGLLGAMRFGESYFSLKFDMYKFTSSLRDSIIIELATLSFLLFWLNNEAKEYEENIERWGMFECNFSLFQTSNENAV